MRPLSWQRHRVAMSPPALRATTAPSRARGRASRRSRRIAPRRQRREQPSRWACRMGFDSTGEIGQKSLHEHDGAARFFSAMHTRIALVKTGWSDSYQGGPVVGRYKHFQEWDEAHEKFNFLQHASGRFYGYLPPIGKQQRPPQPKVADGWLLVFVSARNGNGPLTVVGWYEDATFHDEYIPRPEYADSDVFEMDVHGNKYGYCLSANTAHLIPTTSRNRTVPGTHFKRTPVLYLRGNGKDEAWRRELADIAELVVSASPKTEDLPPKLTFPDAQQRKLVELAAIEAAKKFLNKDHHVKDRQKDNCGYDLLAKHRETGDELHVEVKGTSGETMHFYMSRNEFRYMLSPQWRLIMVTDALGIAKTDIFTATEARSTFNIDPFAWEATVKP